MSSVKEQQKAIYTLGSWTDSLLKVPTTIECPIMWIQGDDFGPPLFEGSGHIHIRSRMQMDFVMHATPRDHRETFEHLSRTQGNPYQCRVFATDYRGTEWNGGWTMLQVGEQYRNVWRLSGRVEELQTSVSGHRVARESGVEVIYDTGLRLPIPLNMVTSVRQEENEVLWSRKPGAKTIEVAGTKIRFFHAPEGQFIWAIADTSPFFTHPYAENWISEPLCLLLGQLVFPRLVARNLGDSEATISLRSSPSLDATPLIVSILGDDPYLAHERFWNLYCDILTMVVHAKDKAGHSNFEAHPLTRYYHEIIQAITGSHWVLCMTLASMVEGVVKMLFLEEDCKSDFSSADIESLKQHIRAWGGNGCLRGRILDSVAYAESKGIRQLLNALSKQGLINKKHIKTWTSVRNQVMHGNLVSPWLDQELAQRLQQLIELARNLSTAYIRKSISLVEAKAAAPGVI